MLFWKLIVTYLYVYDIYVYIHNLQYITNMQQHTIEPYYISTPIKRVDLNLGDCFRYVFILGTSSSSSSSSLLIKLLADVHLRGLELLLAAFLSDS
jgi:hypothetical protein